jgi:hypothetical protein
VLATLRQRGTAKQGARDRRLGGDDIGCLTS